MRVGDFYEVMGENAKAVAAELDLILTSRDVGLDERIPMCGFPYHVTDEYTEKILKIHSVVVMEDGEEKYICSCAEAVDQSEQETMLSTSKRPCGGNYEQRDVGQVKSDGTAVFSGTCGACRSNPLAENGFQKECKYGGGDGYTLFP